MASNVYPVKHPSGTLTTAELHLLLANPTVLSRRIAEISSMRFNADYQLSGRFDGTGGGMFYETLVDAFAGEDPEAVAPNGEFRNVVLDDGTVVSAATVKWGLETIFTDEKVARQGITHVNRGILRLVNTIVRHVDSIAMAVIQSRVTSTFTVPEPTTAGALVEGLTTIRQERGDLGLGIDLDTVVLKPADYAKVIGMLVDDKALPREQGNIVVSGNLPVDALGYTWATTPHYQGTVPLLVDRENLGGMADEDLQSPDYTRDPTSNIDVFTERTGRDGRRVRARRVTVPVVTEPMAGVRLLGWNG
jgi:hypothetical protein